MAIDKFGKGGFDSADKSFQGLGNLGSTSQFTVVGCTDNTMFNFNPGANTPCCTLCDGSDDNEITSGACCIPVIYGCLDPSANNFNNTDVNNPNNGSLLGCSFTNPPVCFPTGCDIYHGQNIAANLYPPGFSPGGPPCSNPLIDANTSPDPSDPIWGGHTCQWQGCTDPTAINYDPQANVDIGTCIPTILGCMDNSMDPNSFTYWNGQVISQTAPNVLFKINEGTMGQPNGSLDYHLYTNSWSGLLDPYSLTAPNVQQPNAPCGPSSPVNCIPTTADPTACGDYTMIGNNECCQARIYGCMQPSGTLNYDATANTEPPSFCELAIPGCTDGSACNFSSAAQQDDGSCTRCDGIANQFADNYTGTTTHCANNNGCKYCPPVINFDAGNSTPTTIDVTWAQLGSVSYASIVNYQLRYRVNPNGGWIYIPNIPVGTNSYTVQGLTPDTQYKFQLKTHCSNTDSGTAGGGWSVASEVKSTAELMGCTDPAANNYDSTVTSDDGSCLYTGCMDAFPLAINQAVFIHPTNGITYYATTDTVPSSCLPVVYGCIDSGSCDGTNCGTQGYTSNSPAGCDPAGGSCVQATNYDPLANADDGSCIYPPIGCLDPAAINVAPLLIFNDPNAIHDNSCLYDGCTDPSANNYSFGDNNTGLPAVNGNMTGPVVAYYDPAYLTSVYGYLASPGFDYSTSYVSNVGHPTTGAPLVLTGTASDNGLCTYTINGCTDSAANNYNPTANSDDGSCCFGDTDFGIDGFKTNDGTSTGVQTIPCHIGCTTPGYTNSSMSNHQFNTPNTPVFTDTHPSIRNAADPGGCLNWGVDPTFIWNKYNVGDPLHASNLLTQSFGSSYTTTIASNTITSKQNMHGIDYSLSCDDGNNGYDNTSSGCPNMDNYSDLLWEYNSKLTVTIDNSTINKRIRDGEDSMLVRAVLGSYSPMVGGAYTTTHPYLPFWGNNAERSVAANPVSPDGELGINAGAAPTWGGQDTDVRTQGGTWFSSKGDLLWDYVKSYGSGNNDRTSLINDAKNNTYFSSLTGVVHSKFQHTLRLTFKTGHGAIIAKDTLQINVGCMDPNAYNYCETCNAMQPFNKYDPSQPVSNTNWTICDYGSANMAVGF